MFRFLLAACVILSVNAEMTNVDVSLKIQSKLRELMDSVKDIKDEIDKYFSRVGGDPMEWYERHAGSLEENARLIGVLKENITSTITILNYTGKFPTQLSLQREKRRSEAIGEALATLAIRADNSSAELGDARSRMALALAQQGRADESMNEAQVRLLGMRRSLDALIKREGELDFRLNTLLSTQVAHKARAQAVSEGERKAKENVENVKRKTKDIENAINEARSQLQALKTRSRETPSAASVKIPSVNFIKSVKTASGRGKRIKLILLSD